MPQKTKHTPMMEQYFAIKAQYQDAFLFYRLGDFYELFYDDAIKVSQLLELTLTSRNKNADDPIPMCGVPHHAAQGYIDTLVEQGYKVAICEQMEDPKLAKGMVKREVIQLVTPGTTMTGKTLEAKANNYLSALGQEKGVFGFSYVDLTTGELKVAKLFDEAGVLNEATALETKEMVLTTEIAETLKKKLQDRLNLVFSQQLTNNQTSEENYLTQHLIDPLEKSVVGKLITYLQTTQKRSLDHLQLAVNYEPKDYLSLDYFSKYNLELARSIRGKGKSGTLLWLLDETNTAMGGRLLKQWLDRPLISETRILKRQDMTEKLMKSFFERSDLKEALKKVYDLERLAGRVAFGNVNGRDVIQLKNSLKQIPTIRTLLQGINQGEFSELLEHLNPLEDLVTYIEKAIVEDPPLSVTEGKLIRDGFNEQLDVYRDAMAHGKEWIVALEAKEREETGVKTLKVGMNRVTGYYIEVTKANLSALPEGRYQRRQTLANAERFITPELKEMEEKIFTAEEKSVDLEYELFLAVREMVKKYIADLQKLAASVAELDCLMSFATIAETYNYVRPQLIPQGKELIIENGRHPVVEKVMGHQRYVPNSVMMKENTDVLLITGPNMSGKSTYMRQVALTAIMAQMGSFVPADSCVLPIFDHIFTRIGASDDLIAGQSTFMVEMMEANEALRHGTSQSLVLFDELGRGTATYDGMALAQGIIEYIHDKIKAKTLFSTHYHELTVLEESLNRLRNVHVGAVEENGELVFLHKIMPGAADKSYGIHVAKIAGLPSSLLKRSSEILDRLEKSKTHTNKETLLEQEIPVNQTEKLVEEPTGQLALFAEEPLEKAQPSKKEQEIINELKKINLMNTTPLEAMNLLSQLQKKL